MAARTDRQETAQDERGAPMPYDILIIGGGINGAGIARDAAGRGYSVFLAEAGDLAGGTSSASTKLIHGGLRYLEHYEFRLVRDALTEREVLWRIAPHIVKPLRFILPHHAELRPAWLLRLGLFIYDHLGGRKLLPPTSGVDLHDGPFRNVLRPEFRKGFEYSDCWVDDARLVILNARAAADSGAEIHTRTAVTRAERLGGLWCVTLTDTISGVTRQVRAKTLVNAAGPWADQTIALTGKHENSANIRLVQGSHIILPKLYDDERCFIFQNADGRIFFSIPYEDRYTLVGTTDMDFFGDPRDCKASEAEIEYLCASVSAYFRKPVRPEDVVWTYSGVRALCADMRGKAQEATRDYLISTEGLPGQAPLVNIFGGKITTYRRLASSVIAEIARHLGECGREWTHDAALPGGNFPVDGLKELERAFLRRHPWISETHARRLLRLYGTQAEAIIGDATRTADLGEHFGADLYEAEVDYLVKLEWARTAQDILWRRTKLGLRKDVDLKKLETSLFKMTAGHLS